MCTWVESKIEAGHISGTTPLEYTKRLAYLYRQAHPSRSSVTLTDYAAALRRDPALRAQQAVPMTRDEYHEVLRRADHLSVYIYFMLMWLTASRAADMARLQVRSFETQSASERPDGRLFTRITWHGGVKASTLPHTDFVLLTPKQTEGLRAVLSRTPDQEACPFDSWSANDVAIALRALTGNPALTAHSVKRGVLQHLIEQGISLPSVVYKAKHADEKHTRVYLGGSNWALANRADQTAEALL
jgi:integrase